MTCVEPGAPALRAGKSLFGARVRIENTLLVLQRVNFRRHKGKERRGSVGRTLSLWEMCGQRDRTAMMMSVALLDVGLLKNSGYRRTMRDSMAELEEGWMH